MRICLYILSIAAVVLHACYATAEADSADRETPIQPRALEDSSRDGLRDPFWPVGYDPDAARREAERGGKSADEVAAERDRLEESWNEAQTRLKITGLSRMADQGYFAIINDQMVRAGDTVSIETSEGIFVWKVADIGSEGIKLRRLRVRGYSKKD